MKRLYLFRHGETDWNVEERFQGHIDIPLNERGREQARSLIPVLKDYSIEAILSSDLCRALETAQIVASALQIPVFRDAGLREAYLGRAQGMTKKEIEDHFDASLVQRWRSTRLSDADVSYPEGETGNQVYERAFQSIVQFFIANGVTRIGIACHGGVIRRVMHRVLPPDSPPISIPNGIVYELGFNSEQNTLFSI